MLVLPTNTANFIVRIIALLALPYLTFEMLAHGLNDPTSAKVLFEIKLLHFQFKAIYLLYLVTAGFSFYYCILMLTLVGINKVLIDTVSDQIECRTPIGNKYIHITEIDQYFITKHKNQLKNWQGLLIRTKRGKSIQIPGQNVKHIELLTHYLEEKQIHFAKERKMKFPFN